MVLLAVVGLTGGSARADWPMYRGPGGDGIARQPIRTNWTEQPPVLLWRKPLTNGLSSVAVSAGRVFTQVRQGGALNGTEICVALDAATGNQLWASPVGLARYPDGGVGGDDGPRSTPAVGGDRVYVLGSYLTLHCFDAATGETIWSKDLRAELGAEVIPWQNAASPLIEGDLLLLNGNAAPNRVLAVRTSDGSIAWRLHNEAMTHATPVPATIHGVRQVVFWTQSGLLSVDPQTGTALWRFPVRYSTSSAASPVVDGDTVFCSAAYNTGANAARITRTGDTFTATARWPRRSSRPIHWSTPVVVDGFVYGLFELPNALGCLSLATGEDRWFESGFGYGATLLVNGKILALAESGDVVLVEPDPNQYREIDRFRAVNSRCWNSPALSEGVLYVRSTTELAAFDLSVAVAAPLRLSASHDAAAGRIRFEVTSTDGQPIDSSRAARIAIVQSDDLTRPLAEWGISPVSLTLEGGVLRAELPIATDPAARYYLVREQQ
ncbi:MAG: PQQ-like beta-propeller repeat protein [Bryobacteraceae bacterium]|nr:PQQ-like beta-propeller repeat protein [Bryobacteraceae bacterium]